MAICDSGCFVPLPPPYSNACGVVTKPGGINRIGFLMCDFEFTDITNQAEWDNAIANGDAVWSGLLYASKPKPSFTKKRVNGCSQERVVGIQKTITFQDYNDDDGTGRSTPCEFWNTIQENPDAYRLVFITCDDYLYGPIDNFTLEIGETIEDTKEGNRYVDGTISWGGISMDCPVATDLIFDQDISVIDICPEMPLKGFGCDSRFAYAGVVNPTIMYVDTLNSANVNTDATHGSLTYCLQQNFPRIILFEVSGRIDYNGDAGQNAHSNFSIRSDAPFSATGECWVVGESAPSPGIEVRGENFELNNVSDILVSHMKIRVGADDTGRDPNDKDCITNLLGDNIVYDHCEFCWSVDEIGGGGTVGNITFTHCLFYEPLHLSKHWDAGSGHAEPERHGLASLNSPNIAVNMTFDKCIIAISFERNPQFNPTAIGCQFVICNCYTYNTEYWIGPDLRGGSPFDIAIVGCCGYASNGDHPAQSDFGADVHNSLHANSKVYVNDLKCKEKDDNPLLTDWECVYDHALHIAGNEGVSPIDLSEYNILSSADVKAYVLANAGTKFPDSHTDRIKNDINLGNVRQPINDPEAMPARVVNWVMSTAQAALSDCSGGYDWSTDGQTFDLNYNAGGATTVTLNANCGTIDLCVAHINTQIAAAGIDYSANVEAYKIWPGTHQIGLRTKTSGADQEIIISNSTMHVGQADAYHAPGFQDDTYTGSDQIGDGWIAIAENVRALTPPADPHEPYVPDCDLTNLEVWILDTFR